MNATFNIRRFGLNIYKELLEKYKIVLGFWAVITLVYLLIWGIALLVGSDIRPEGRGTLAITLLQFYCCLIPFLLYRNENRHIEGTFYGIAPASTLEKTLTILLIVSIVFPTLTTVLMLSLDSLLSAITTGSGFAGHIWGYVFSSERFTTGLITEESRNLVELMFNGIPALFLNPFLSIILSQSAFVFFAMLFRSHKIGKTLLLICGAGFLLSVGATVSIISTVNTFESGVISAAEAEAIEDFVVRFVKAIMVFTCYVLPVAFWVLTYFRIRRIQY